MKSPFIFIKDIFNKFITNINNYFFFLRKNYNLTIDKIFKNSKLKLLFLNTKLLFFFF